jgi:hypothetical protein
VYEKYGQERLKQIEAYENYSITDRCRIPPYADQAGDGDALVARVLVSVGKGVPIVHEKQVSLRHRLKFKTLMTKWTRRVS